VKVGGEAAKVLEIEGEEKSLDLREEEEALRNEEAEDDALIYMTLIDNDDDDDGEGHGFIYENGVADWQE
jgi:hypothetical protein